MARLFPIDAPLALAPMQEVTDCAFVRTLARLGCLPDFLVLPYFRSRRDERPLPAPFLRTMAESAAGIPVRTQLLGSDPAALARDARALLEYPVAGVDLNAGCPSPRVCRKGAGAALLLDLRRFEAALSALRAAIPEGMFSVKCRIGWREKDEWEDILPVLKRVGPDLVTVHARTREGMYRSSVNREAVARAVGELACPVYANGDIADRGTACAWMQAASPAGLMIGRGAVRNPWIFRVLRGGKPPAYRDLLEYALVLMEETARRQGAGESGHCARMKKYLAYLADDLPADFGFRMRRAASRRELIQTLEDHLSSDAPFPELPPPASLAFFG